MSEKILACPYCGSDTCYLDGFLGSRKVVCGCGANGPRGKTDDDAVLLWNAAANALAAKDAEIADAKRRIYDGDMRIGKLEAEIEKLSESVEFFEGVAADFLAERDKLNDGIAEVIKNHDQIVQVKEMLIDKLERDIANIPTWEGVAKNIQTENDRLKAALEQTEEERHETASKLSMALIRVAAGDKRQDELEAEIEKLNAEIQHLRTTINILTTSANAVIEQRDGLRNQRDEITRDYDNERNRANKLESEIDPLRYELSGRKLEIVAAKQKIDYLESLVESWKNVAQNLRHLQEETLDQRDEITRDYDNERNEQGVD